MRRRLAAVAVAIVIAGLAVRFAPVLPEWLRDAGGGALYVCLMAVLIQWIGPELSAFEAAALALALTVAIEFGQLSDSPKLISARSTLVGRLVLGSTFSWWDFPPYVFGSALAFWLLRAMRGRPIR